MEVLNGRAQRAQVKPEKRFRLFGQRYDLSEVLVGVLLIVPSVFL